MSSFAKGDVPGVGDESIERSLCHVKKRTTFIIKINRLAGSDCFVNKLYRKCPTATKHKNAQGCGKCIENVRNIITMNVIALG